MYEHPEVLHLLTLTAVVLAIPPLASALVPKRAGTLRTPVPLQTDRDGRIEFFDVLKGIAILAVIVIHVTDLWQLASTASGTVVLDAVDASMRFALPFFFIISGILLRPPTMSLSGIGSFYRIRFTALALPYLLVGTALYYYHNLSLGELWYGLYTGSLSVPYYFLIILFQLYLIYPFVVELARKRWFVYTMLIFSIIAQLSPFWYVLDVPLAFRFLAFFVWGIHMRDLILSGNIPRTLVPWLALVVLFWAGYMLFPGAYYNMRPYYGIGMFMLLYLTYTANHIPPPVTKFVARIGSISLWIFLIHFPIMTWLFPILTDHLPQNTVLLFLCLTVIAVVVSTVLGFICAHVYELLVRATGYRRAT